VFVPHVIVGVLILVFGAAAETLPSSELAAIATKATKAIVDLSPTLGAL